MAASTLQWQNKGVGAETVCMYTGKFRPHLQERHEILPSWSHVSQQNPQAPVRPNTDAPGAQGQEQKTTIETLNSWGWRYKAAGPGYYTNTIRSLPPLGEETETLSHTRSPQIKGRSVIAMGARNWNNESVPPSRPRCTGLCETKLSQDKI